MTPSPDYAAGSKLLRERQAALWLVVLIVAIALAWLVNARWVLKRGLPLARFGLAAGYYLTLLMVILGAR